MKKFIFKLLKYYNYPIKGSICRCKFYLQANTFSYELHDSKKICFNKNSLLYESKVFYWNHLNKHSKLNDYKYMLKDIKKNSKRFK